MINKWSAKDFNYEKAREKLADKVIVFTGRGFTVRWELAQFAKYSGATVEGTITKRTTTLIVGEKPGSKLRKAKLQGCEIISIEEYYKILCGDFTKDIHEIELTIDHLNI